MKSKIKFTVGNAKQLEKAQKLLSLFPDEISTQIGHVDIIDHVGQDKLQCIINASEQYPTVLLPNNAWSITTFDDHILVVYNEFTFKIPRVPSVKIINYRFIECEDLQQFKM